MNCTKNEENWLANYEALKAYIGEHHHLPDKHRVECRALLNWAKYQRKRIKDGALDEEKTRLFNELMEQRLTEHTGGRKKAVQQALKLDFLHHKSGDML